MSDYVKDNNRRFKHFSNSYDFFAERLILLSGGNPRQSLLSEIASQETLQVLDICTGTGIVSCSIAAAYPHFHVQGIDISPDMLEAAQYKINSQQLKNIQIHNMDATKMYFSDHFFDLVNVSFGLHEMPYAIMIKVLHEIHRVLKINGKLYITDFDTPARIWNKVFFPIFLSLAEPSYVSSFLQYDWNRILSESGLATQKVQKFNCIKMIQAVNLDIE